jgi:hypothetical protein
MNWLLAQDNVAVISTLVQLMIALWCLVIAIMYQQLAGGLYSVASGKITFYDWLNWGTYVIAWSFMFAFLVPFPKTYALSLEVLERIYQLGISVSPVFALISWWYGRYRTTDQHEMEVNQKLCVRYLILGILSAIGLYLVWYRMGKVS